MMTTDKIIEDWYDKMRKGIDTKTFIMINSEDVNELKKEIKNEI